MVKHGIDNFRRGLLLLLLFIGVHAAIFAQVTATASVSATIVTPLGISREINMDFGNVAAGATPGSVVLTPAGTRLRTGGVALPNVTGTVTAASFKITGAPNFAYSITLPNAPLTLTNGIDNMTIGFFASNPSTNGMLGNNGTQTLNVGATLNVAALQAVGDYTSVSPFAVTVNYN